MLVRSIAVSMVLWLGVLLQPAVDARAQGQSPDFDAQNAKLRASIAAASELPMRQEPIVVRPPAAGEWALGMVSWVAAGRDGLVYLLQRGEKADPVVVLDSSGSVVRSWGKGLYATPHAIRVDRAGNIWTTDAASSKVIKFSPAGEVLMTIEVGGQPDPCGNFCGTTDVAFAPNGNLLIADGYRNARVLEYSPDGTRLRQWGSAGTGAGQFVLPHSIQVDEAGIIYVADRENGRIQRFDHSGNFLGEWTQYGKTFGLTLAGDALWLSTIPRGPNGTPGWLLKVDRRTGALLGYVEAAGNHGMDVMPNGDLLQAPGPELIPQRYRAQQ